MTPQQKEAEIKKEELQMKENTTENMKVVFTLGELRPVLSLLEGNEDYQRFERGLIIHNFIMLTNESIRTRLATIQEVKEVRQAQRSSDAQSRTQNRFREEKPAAQVEAAEEEEVAEEEVAEEEEEGEVEVADEEPAPKKSLRQKADDLKTRIKQKQKGSNPDVREKRSKDSDYSELEEKELTEDDF